MAAHPGDSSHVVPQQPDLQRLRQSETETEAGTHMDLPQLRTRHDRNLNAAINLRNLIMPEGRGRNRRAQDAVVQPRPWDSWQGEPGIVKDGPPIRGRGRGTDARTEVEGPARGKQGSPEPERGNQPDHARRPMPGWRCREIHAKANPVS